MNSPPWRVSRSYNLAPRVQTFNMEVARHYPDMAVGPPDVAADENAILLQSRGSTDNDNLVIGRECDFAPVSRS